jgi:enoyl-CoA hydratase
MRYPAMTDETPKPDEFVRIVIDGAVGSLVLNRPEKLNAMNLKTLEQFSSGLADLTANEEVRVIIIRGEGRAFSTGYDLQRDGGYEEPEAVKNFHKLARHIERYLELWDCPKPIIAAVHGYCLAGATQMCVFADITIVAEDAKIGLPKIPIGGGFITPIWSWLVGPKRAKQMSFVAGSMIDGRTAVEWGWANYAVPADELVAEAQRLAKDIARTPGPILAMKKHSVNRIADLQGFRATVALGAETDALLHMSAAAEELRAVVRDEGMKEAIRKFEQGELG